MRASTGVLLSPENVFGRDELIGQLWRWLEIKSVRLEAERRIGKTSILTRMKAHPPKGWFPLYLDLEKRHTTDEFAEEIATQVEQFLGRFKRAGKRIGQFLTSLGGTKVNGGGVGFTFPSAKDRPEGYWKYLLQESIRDLVEAKEERVVFFFDEMPSLLSAIAKSEAGAARAMEVLDVLRALRHDPDTADGFRMVLTGSIGLHHVLETLRNDGYSNPALNDMEPVEVQPLTTAAAQGLARLLIDGEELKADDPAESARIIADESGGFPFYLQSVVLRLSIDQMTANPADVKKAVQNALTASHDPWQLRYLAGRISTYYPKDEAVTLAILDTAATATAPLPVAEIVKQVKSARPEADPERVRKLLKLLEQDHYVTRDEEGRYRFRFPLLQRWWKLDRGL